MDKRINICSENSLLCEVIVVLTDSQREKLESGKLREQIENIAKDMKLCWDVEKRGNISIAAVGRECGPVIGSEIMHQIEIDATNFMGAIDKLEIPADDIIHFDAEPEEKEICTDKVEFVKTLLHDMNLPSDDGSHVRGALIIDTTTQPFCPEITAWGKMSYDLLKEMCELYIEKYGNK